MNFAFLFPGQGSQSVGMGRDFYENSTQAKILLDSASEACKIDFKHLLFEENELLNKSEYTQPAIVLNSLMAYECLKERLDISSDYALGHSLGEFSALSVQGAFEYNEALSLVNKRGAFMQEACQNIEAGMMVILNLNDSKVEELCEEAQTKGKKIYPANYNCEGQIVVAGLKPDLMEYEVQFKEAGAKRAMLLNMSVASHCPLLEEASLKLTKELEKVVKAKFKPVISNANAKAYADKEEALKLLKAQLTSPVLYKQSIASLEDKVDCFVEFGSSVLKGINKKISTKETYSLTNIQDIDEFIKVIQ